MSRTSRICHAPGTVFVPIYQPFIARFGLAGAAVLGFLELLDRAQPAPGLPLATRQRVIADLQGLAGKNNVDKAIGKLCELGWLKKIEKRKMGATNLVSWTEFALNAERINADMGMPEQEKEEAGNPEVPEPGRRVSQNQETGFPDFGTDPVPIQGPVYIEKEVEKEVLFINNKKGVEQFESLWRGYPRQEQKKKASAAWAALFPRGASQGELADITAGLARWRASATWAANNGQFIHHMSTWLINRLWEERPAPPASQKGERQVSPEFTKPPPAGAPKFKNMVSF